MEDENLIHIQIKYEEGLESKKDFITSQINFLKIAKTIRRYHAIRIEELKLKINLYKKIKAIITNIKKLQKNLPEITTAKINHEIGRENKIVSRIKKTDEILNDKNLENQLEQIQRKLTYLQK